ncbi:imelysin family protein [Bdellovibrio svalbardensis]|uniref:Iron-regulated protein A n=1 Tax=Bdellovibrio svalbardensis TaxID=2972972 RepID=A0ABT6DJE5_9BACT|nr:imelysin family protein [Bdellovibrio svalbardensis]MDG0816983.1 iron-regulated protein A precursor [Bdellovibrio svalbardensis]
MNALKMMVAALSLAVGVQATAATNQEIIQHVSYNVIMQTYVDLASATANLKVAVSNFVSNPTPENLALAQQQWRYTRVPWEASEAFLFGPVDSLGVDPMLDTWPLNRSDLDGVLNGKSPITVDLVHSLGTNLQGFHTIEYLLFGNGVNSNTKPVSAFTSRQFDYLNATATVLAEHAAYLAYAWTTNYDPENSGAPGYVTVISAPSYENPFYSSEGAVMEELIKGMMGIADEVANGKIADPMGGDINSANMALVESPFSWNSLNDFKMNIRSIYSVYTGTYGQVKGPGVQAMVARFNPSLAAKIEADIINCINLIEAIRPAGGGDFGQAIFTADGRARTQRAIEALNALHATLESQILPLADK